MITAIRIIKGKCLNVIALQDGYSCEILDFFNVLRQIRPSELTEVVQDLDWTADNGLMQNHEKFRHLSQNIHQFRTSGGTAVLCFLDTESILALTNGFMIGNNQNSAVGRASLLKEKYDDARLHGYLTYQDEIL